MLLHCLGLLPDECPSLTNEDSSKKVLIDIFSHMTKAQLTLR